MRRPLAAVAALVGAGCVPPGPAAAAPGCAAAGSRTVMATPTARVYYDRRSRPFGCYRLTGRRTALDAGVDRFYAPGDARLGQLRLSRRALGYTWVDPGIPAVWVQSIDLRTARRLRGVRIESRTTFEPSAVAVTDLVVNRRGSTAWVQRVEGQISVWRFDRRGRRRLDASPRIAPASLGRRGARVTWRRAGVRRSASLL